MKHLAAFLALLVGIVAQTAQPANVTGTLLDSNTLPSLGAHLSWSSVPVASYSVYGKVFQYKQDCTQVKTWAEIASTVSGSSYDDYPPADSFGWGGYWCYGISATVGGIESAIAPLHWPVVMGTKWYVLWFYDTPDCSARLGGVNPPAAGTLALTRVRNGVSDVLPQVVGVNPFRFAGFARFLSYDVINLQLTLPDGKVITLPRAFEIQGTPAVDDSAPYVVIDLNSADDSFCEVQTWRYFQPGKNNP